MKNTFPLILIAGLFLLASSCTKSTYSEDISSASDVNDIENIGCGTTTWDLTAGQTIDVGSVTAWNDQDNLYIEYTLDYAGACFGQLHAWVGRDLSNLPKNPQGILVPGKFPYKADATGLTTYTFTIPLADFAGECNDNLYMVTHAEVNMDCNAATPGHETAFGGPTAGSGPRWWFYSEYSICCDDDNNGDDCREETAFGGTATGGGPAWWFYFDTQGDACQTIWAGQSENAGQVCYDMATGILTITFSNGWELADVSEPVKVQGYNALPATRPAAGQFTLYKGTSLTVDGDGSRYYVIHLDVKNCE